ncbi:MAG: hypothetical protein RL219_877 [Actinomycetota bacterium]
MTVGDSTSGRVAVIGGGPGGLLAAETLARLGCTVTVFEQMRSVGRKFLLAGRSGLNLTHSEPTRELVARYSPVPAPLSDALAAYDADAVRSWAESLGEDTFVGSSGRVFPRSWRATPLLRAWLRRLDTLGVSIITRRRWTGVDEFTEAGQRTLRLHFISPDTGTTDSSTTGTGTTGGDTVEVDAVVLALGGASWPRVGSNGRWTDILGQHSIEVTPLEPSNAAALVNWSPIFVERFHGVPLKNLAVTVAGVTVRGDAVVTRAGLEGTPIYAHSSRIREQCARDGHATLLVDLHPDLTVESLSTRLVRRRPRESTTTWLRRSAGLDPVAVALIREVVGANPDRDPAAMAELIKSVPLTVTGLAGLERAISTAGGVSWSELDEHFMLRQLPGVFVAGEMLDWDAPTGGYLLQATFSTAVAAAMGAYRWVHPDRGVVL